MQLVLLMLGAVLIMFGALRLIYAPNYQKGLDMFWNGDAAGAETYLLDYAGQHPEEVEPRIGLVLTSLALGKLEVAEAQWLFVNEPAPAGGDDASIRLPISRIERWRNQNFREMYKIEGELCYAQAWLTGERLLLAYRRNDPPESIETARMSHDQYMKNFRKFIELREGQADPNKDSAGKWGKRYAELERRIEKGQRIDDVLAALQKMTSPNRLPADEKPETLLAMLDPHLNRALRETPDEVRVHTWRMLVLASLAHHNTTLPGGYLASDELHAAAAKAEQLAKAREMGSDAVNESRYVLAYACALTELARHKPDDARTLLEYATNALSQSESWLAKVPHDHYSRKELDALREYVVTSHSAATGK